MPRLTATFFVRTTGVLFTLALMLALASAPAQASGLSDAQRQAILGLLQSFGAEQNILDNVGTALGDTTQVATSSNSTVTCIDLTETLSQGDSDDTSAGQVSLLQQFLNITPTTGYFGPITERAVQAWQAAHGVVSSGSPNTNGYGVVGSATRQALACNPSSVTISSGDGRPRAVIDQNSLTTGLSLPTITGTAANTSSVIVVVRGLPSLTSTVTNGRWLVTVPTNVATGYSLVQVFDSTGTVVLAAGTLIVTTSTLPSTTGTGTTGVGSPYTTGTTPRATIDVSTLSNSTATPVITGTAYNIGSIGIAIQGYPTLLVRVVSGKWSMRLAYGSGGGLGEGTYTVQIIDPSNNHVLTTGQLSISLPPTPNPPGSESGGTENPNAPDPGDSSSAGFGAVVMSNLTTFLPILPSLFFRIFSW